MGRRQREWAKRKRLELILSLGGVCPRCGDETLENLVIHHLESREWDLRKKDPSARVSRYLLEARLGLVAVLCNRCNLQVAYQPDPDIAPF